MFNSGIPAKINNALTDLIAIATNFLELRQNERSTAAPSNPVAGMLWVKKDSPTTGNDALAIRNPANNAWDKIYSSDQVVLSAPATTPFLLVASTAPTGWTQVTTWNDRVLRVVSGATGGTTGGSWTISGGVPAHTHTGPSHTHDLVNAGDLHADRGTPSHIGGVTVSGGELLTLTTQYGTNSQNASSTTSASGTGATGSSGPWVPQYVDVIACTKNQETVS